MKMLSTQQIFNKVAKHLLTQNKRVRYDGLSQWVDHRGNLCASACLVKPSLRKGLGNEDYWHDGRELLANSGVDWNSHYDIVDALTIVHDDNKPSRWPEKLRAVAKRFKLKVPEYLKNA